MSEHRATVEWDRSGDFRYETSSRAHLLRFDTIAVPGARQYPCNGAELSSCHMLWFLHLACQRKWAVERHVDQAVGVLDRTWMSRVTLHPKVTFSGTAPSAKEIEAVHHAAHERCFIANSVKTEVIVEPC